MRRMGMLWLAALLAAVPCTGDVTADFNKIVNDFWAWRLENDPDFATPIGENRYNDRLTSYNITTYVERKDVADATLEKLRKIDSMSLSKADQQNFAVFKDALETVSDGYEWFEYGTLNPVDFIDGFQTDPSYMASVTPFKTEEDYNNYLKRLELIQTRLAEQTELFRRAMALNRTMNKVSVDRVPDQIEKFLTDDTKQFSLYEPFNETLDNLTIPEDTKNTLRARAVVVLLNNFMNPYREFKRFLENEYIPATRAGWGVSSWHKGQEYYRACLKWHLSEDKTAEEIHELGLAEVARISGQMLKIIREKGFNGTIREYFQFLRADPQFKLRTGEEILEAYKDIVFNRVDNKLKDYFDNIPNLPLEIKPMEYDGPGGAYFPGSADGSRPGTFYANVLRPNATNTFDMMALTLHEANPGHHMQDSVAILQPLPDFRKYAPYAMYSVPFAFPSYTAYIEGWGLYSEYLGEEMGLYKDEYELLGRYSGEIFRACRLVVDTGLHAFGWEREKAIQYMLNYTSMNRPNTEIEIDRYITLPGQACAYKYGEIKILQLRRKAEQELGDSFNLKQFHATILDLAAVPLQVMEAAVDEMIQNVKDAQKKPNSVSRVQVEWMALSFALIMALTIGA